MLKRKKMKLVFCLFGPLIYKLFVGLNDKKIYLELNTCMYVCMYVCM